MKTVYTVLPIYDSTIKQDYNRTGAIVPIFTPRHRLPSWQYNAEATVVGAVSRIDLVNVATGALTNITTYFPTLSDDYALTTDTYYKYDGDTLNYLLPYGAYYLKITHNNNYIFYSDIFVVTDIYPNLGTAWTNSAYETFTSSGMAITQAIETLADGVGRAWTNTFTLKPLETITVIFYETLSAGTAPTVQFYNNDTTTTVDSDVSAAGLNVFTYTATIGGNYKIRFENLATVTFSITEMMIIRSYSSNFIRIDFHDTHDLGDIVYQDGFTQSVWLQTQLNTPTHEPVTVGEEKNGIFIAEKIITKYKYRIVYYCGPVLYRALLRLPQHDTITITDEVGFNYTPAVGNIQVNPMNWNTFDTGTLEIIFNDNTEFIWTKEANNLT